MFLNRVGAALLLLSLVIWGHVAHSYAQERNVSFHSEIFFSTSTKEILPYWLTANQFGVIDSSPRTGTAILGFSAQPQDLGPFTYNLGVDVVSRIGGHPSLFLQQVYGELRWGPFLMTAGRKEVTSGEVHELSLGSMTMSKNAAPPARISISWPEFVAIPGTGKFLAVKGYLGHGWIEGDRMVNDGFLHEKYLYLQLGMPEWRVKGRAGLLHYTMWGGVPIREGRGDRLPSSFNDFWRVFFIRGADEEIIIGLNGERTNVLGNSLGAYDFSLHFDLTRMRIHAYRQFYLEDTVSLAFRNGWDGLWGLGFTFNNEGLVRSVLWEHVNTKRQSSKKDEPRGTDNYYNHAIYESGWTHRGRTLGTPLLLSVEGYEGVLNNIILAHHLGLEGAVSDAFAYKLFFTFSRNYGANSIVDSETLERIRNARFDEPVHRYSFMFEGSSTILGQEKVDAFARIGYDWGDRELLPTRNFGVTFGIRHTGVF